MNPIRLAGYNAFFNYVRRESNPFPEHSADALEWEEGWKQAEGEWMEASMDINMY